MGPFILYVKYTFNQERIDIFPTVDLATEHGEKNFPEKWMFINYQNLTVRTYSPNTKKWELVNHK